MIHLLAPNTHELDSTPEFALDDEVRAWPWTQTWSEPLLDGPSALELKQTIEFAHDIEPELEFEPLLGSPNEPAAKAHNRPR
jgi:hypothetical protein